MDGWTYSLFLGWLRPSRLRPCKLLTSDQVVDHSVLPGGTSSHLFFMVPISGAQNSTNVYVSSFLSMIVRGSSFKFV